MIGYGQNWINRNGLYRSIKRRRRSSSTTSTTDLRVDNIKVVCKLSKLNKDVLSGCDIVMSRQGIQHLLVNMEKAIVKETLKSATSKESKTNNAISKKRSKSVDHPQKNRCNFLCWLQKHGKKAAKTYKMVKSKATLSKRCHSFSSSVEEIHSPAEEKCCCASFKDILSKKESTEAFRRFLVSEMSEENLDFYLAVESYKQQPAEKQQVEAEKIFEEFIAPCSRNEINVDCHVRKETKANLQSPDDKSFDLAQRQIFRLMETDSYRRFSEQFR